MNDRGVTETLSTDGTEGYLESYRAFLSYQSHAPFRMQFVNEAGEASDWHGCSGYTPIGIDLDRSGSVERIDGEFSIDIDGDGRVDVLREWFAPSEGILVDTTHPMVGGVVASKHLFGADREEYHDGFEKLAALDTNADGMVAGEEMEGLAVWIDSNSNAVVEEGELFSLDTFDIVGLSTFHKDLKSYAILLDGSFMLMEDLWFN